MGINLRREDDRVIVSAENEDGKLVDLIIERFDAPISHHVSEHGIRLCFAAAIRNRETDNE
jgi:hypothetical protein